MYQIKLEQFDGPLDLLLQLIEKQELDISQISLAKVTDQYLAYLDTLNDIGASDLADFLVVATKLLIIKSRSLLPKTDEVEENDNQLELQLKMYKEYLEACKLIEQMIKSDTQCFFRDKIAMQKEKTFSPPDGINTQELGQAFEEIIKRISYIVSLPERVMDKAVSLSEMVVNLRKAVNNFEKTSFKNMIGQAKSRTEIVVCFMALLELIKSGEIAVNQQNIFEDIIVEKV